VPRSHVGMRRGQEEKNRENTLSGGGNFGPRQGVLNTRPSEATFYAAPGTARGQRMMDLKHASVRPGQRWRPDLAGNQMSSQLALRRHPRQYRIHDDKRERKHCL